jgi:uncharacterized protein (TIGR00251 family)
MKRTGINLDCANKDGFSIRRSPQGIVFKVFVQPKSSQNMIVGLHGDTLKIKLTAPPVDNAANMMCLKFLAKALNLPKSSLDIIAGHTSRIKQVLLKAGPGSITAQEYNRLEQLVEKLTGP